ncbi:hypothetical protein ABT297_34480 [Dactylosporangium sp. NPDC000555]|uniref:hypothetical protein n=1 Tax=Dactylosporangium sp. NPDC000555 TaxID=3154260 RepID=UPI003327776C
MTARVTQLKHPQIVMLDGSLRTTGGDGVVDVLPLEERDEHVVADPAMSRSVP